MGLAGLNVRPVTDMVERTESSVIDGEIVSAELLEASERIVVKSVPRVIEAVREEVGSVSMIGALDDTEDPSGVGSDEVSVFVATEARDSRDVAVVSMESASDGGKRLLVDRILGL